MRSRVALVLLGLWTVLEGCGASTSPVGDGGSDASGACAPSPTAVAPPANTCAPVSGPTLGATETRVAESAPGVSTFAIESIEASQDRVQPTCSRLPWVNGGDATVRFVAPTGGRWRITARGAGLHALSARRGCRADVGCAVFDDYTGANIREHIVLDLQAQRGEPFDLSLDGCPSGTRCQYSITAERVGALACPLPENVCAGRATCALDPCDRERFVCEPQPERATLEAIGLEGVSLRLDASSRAALLTGRASMWPRGLASHRDVLFVEWLAADGTAMGTPDIVSALVLREGVIVPASINARPMAARARLWFGAANAPFGRPPAERDRGSTLVDVTPWVRVAAGGACVQGSLETLCETRHRCVAAAAGGGGASTCVASSDLAIQESSAFAHLRTRTLRISATGTTPARPVTQLSVSLLDASGAIVFVRNNQFATNSSADRNDGAFAVEARISAVPMDALARATTARITAIARDSTESAPVDIAVRAARELGAAESCAAIDEACVQGFDCNRVGSSESMVCEPAPPARPCGVAPSAGVWSPPGSGTHLLTGNAIHWGGTIDCDASRSVHEINVEFVAPTTGRYRFEPEGLRSLEMRLTCEQTQCLREAALAPIEVDLRAGQRLLLGALANTEASVLFTLRAVVP